MPAPSWPAAGSRRQRPCARGLWPVGRQGGSPTPRRTRSTTCCAGPRTSPSSWPAAPSSRRPRTACRSFPPTTTPGSTATCARPCCARGPSSRVSGTRAGSASTPCPTAPRCAWASTFRPGSRCPRSSAAGRCASRSRATGSRTSPRARLCGCPPSETREDARGSSYATRSRSRLPIAPARPSRVPTRASRPSSR